MPGTASESCVIEGIKGVGIPERTGRGTENCWLCAELGALLEGQRLKVRSEPAQGTASTRAAGKGGVITPAGGGADGVMQ